MPKRISGVPPSALHTYRGRVTCEWTRTRLGVDDVVQRLLRNAAARGVLSALVRTVEGVQLTMAAQTSSPSSTPKPSSPPPAYTEFPDQSSQQQSSTMSAPDPAPFPTHAGYGPTPIAQQTQLLPYYDPRSPHALAEAGVRARRRFIGAMLWAVAIVLLASSITGYEVHLRVNGARVGGQARSLFEDRESMTS